MRKALMYALLSSCILGAFPIQSFAFTDIGASAAVIGGATNQLNVTALQGPNTGFYGNAIGWDIKPAAGLTACTFSILVTPVGTPKDAINMDLRFASSTNNGGTLTSQGTLIQHAISGWQVTTNPQTITFSFSPCVPLAAGSHYLYVLTRTGGYDNTNYYYIASASNSSNTIYGGAAVSTVIDAINVQQVNAWNSTLAMDFAINGTTDLGYPIGPPVAFGNTVMNSLTVLNDQNASSTLGSSSGISQFLNVPSILAAKFPFNYIAALAQDFGIFSLSTSTTFYNYSFDFPITGTSTQSANIQWIPSHWSFLSTTTISRYYPDSFRMNFRYIIGLAAAAAWGILMYRKITQLS